MKKTLLAAALVTGFAGVAHAESSVTLYGLVDAGYGYQNIETKIRGDYPHTKTSTRNFGVRNGVMNGNRWGLKGSEDLGNGTSAIFVLESGFDLGDGTQGQGGRLFGRQAYVGLTGDSWGTFTIGRQYNAGDTFVAPIDPFGTGGGYAAGNTIFGNSLSERYDNVLKYVSPSFNGFQFGLGVVHDDTRTKVNGVTTVKDRLFGVTSGLSYNNGPIYIGATFDYINAKTLTSNPKTKAWNIGGTYDFDVVKLHLLYGGQADGHVSTSLSGGVGALAAAAITDSPAFTTGFGGEGLKQHSWLAGLSAPVGDAGKVMFSYAGNTVKNTDVNADLKVKSHNFALGYRHSLSKRTSVYGVASYGWSEAKERNLPGTGKAKTTATQAIIGLQHRF
jgi:predicted porin